MDTSVKFPPTASATMANPLAGFLAKATIEVTGKQIEKFPLLKDNMPAGATVFIALIEAQDLEAQINACAELRKLGFNPVRMFRRASCATRPISRRAFRPSATRPVSRPCWRWGAVRPNPSASSMPRSR